MTHGLPIVLLRKCRFYGPKIRFGLDAHCRLLAVVR